MVLIGIGAIACAFLGYRQWGWWLPLTLACAKNAMPVILFLKLFQNLEEPRLVGIAIGTSLVVDLAIFYAAFAIAWAFARNSRLRKGTP
jgi:hypothetical protein